MALLPSARSVPPPPSRLRLSSPEQVLAAVPYLLGFAPARSVVVLSLRGKQVGLTMRLDLDTPSPQLRKIVVNRLRGDGATTAVLIMFDPDDAAGSGGRPGADLARSLIRAIRRDGMAVKDALGVSRGRFWSYLCSEPGCCPPQGRALAAAGEPAHSLVAASFVAMGTAPLASREELAASIAASPERQRELAAAFAQALTTPAASALELWWTVVERYTQAPPRSGRGLSGAQVATLVLSLRDVAVRDEIVSWTAGEQITGVLAVMRELAPLAPPPFDVQVLAVLAWAAFSFGDGALAAIALQRALDADPVHRLARLLSIALENGVTPLQLKGISTELGAGVTPAGLTNGVRRPDER